MYKRYIYLFVFILANLLQICGYSAAFQNLNFESATIAPTPVGSYGSLYADPSMAFPGWTVGTGGTSYPNYTLYNNLTLGSVAQVLVGPNYPNAIGYSPLEGSYSALLQFGPNSALGTPALIQTGLVPTEARYITFLVSQTHNDARVSLNGQIIALYDIGGGRVAGNISAYAGLEAALEFSTTSYNGHWLYFDDVQFSAVPEPGVLSLLGFGLLSGACFFWRSCRRGNQ
jgi:hypothetical protein